VTQTLYSGTALAAIKGAKELRRMNEATTEAQKREIIHQVRTAFYQALLAQEQVRITALSVERTRKTLEEKAQIARNHLKLLIGIPVEHPLRLRGELTPPEGEGWLFTQTSLQNLLQEALQRRPDLQQAYYAINVQRAQIGLTRAGFWPSLSAFLDMSYVGNVPDNRVVVLSNPNDPFTFTQQKRAFFSDAYWQPNIAVGVRLNWNIFNGFQTRAHLKQDLVELERARIRYAQLTEQVKAEIDQALRNLQSAYQRILSQEQNMKRAELNYTFAQKRLQEGMAMPIEERQASQLLDQARLNYLQAVYDYLVAQSQFEKATGIPLHNLSSERMTLKMEK